MNECTICKSTDLFHHEGRRTDVCECGDYRRQHEDLTGRCLLPNNLAHGFKPCRAFRLSKEHHEFVAKESV